MKLRALTQRGSLALKQFIESPDGPTAPLPLHILEDQEMSRPIGVAVEVPKRRFTTRIDLARAIDEMLPDARTTLVQDPGIWNFLALYLMDQLAPVKDGRRVFGASYRFIFSGDWRHAYRHLVAGAYVVYKNHGEASRLILCPPVYKHGDIAEQLASRRDFIINRALIDAANLLYLDRNTGKPKSGITNRKKPGTLRRLTTVLRQLERNYDLLSMTAEQLLAILPAEFDRWRGGAA